MSHVRNVCRTGMLKRNEIAQKRSVDSACGKPRLPNPLRSPGLEAKVMGYGPAVPELESQPQHSIAR